MEEYKEFEVGDFIEKSEVYTSEGSSKYRRMADFCNREGLVMKEDTICMNPEVEQMEDEINIEVYIISKPDEPKKPTAAEMDEAKIAEAEAYLRETDWMVIKCSELGLTMAERYPAEHAKRTECRRIINESEQKLRENVK